MKTFAVWVEGVLGLHAVHLVDAYFESTAEEREISKGYKVLFVRKW